MRFVREKTENGHMYYFQTLKGLKYPIAEFESHIEAEEYVLDFLSPLLGKAEVSEWEEYIIWKLDVIILLEKEEREMGDRFKDNVLLKHRWKIINDGKDNKQSKSWFY